MAVSSLTFSMIPTTLQPLSCSRAELSARMGRSLRLLKPCRGGRQTPQTQGPAVLQLPRQQGAPGAELGSTEPAPHREQRSWP